VKGKAKVVPVL